MKAYPNAGQQYLANRIIRLLQKSCAANEIGIEACWLVTCVALVEDAKRYSGPVTFWTGQLLPITGFNSWGRLDRARDRAVQSGWLYYQAGTNRKCGVYWCEIPDHVLRVFNDSPVDEINHHSGDHQNGDLLQVNHQKRAHNVERNVIETGSKRNRNGEPSIPVPVPVPEREGAPPSHTPNAKFSKPTADDVRAYAIERGHKTFDAGKFVDHYESNGWRVGKNAMKDWRASVRNWIRTGGTQSTGKATVNPEAESAWQNILDGLTTHGRYGDAPGKIRSQIGENAWQALSKIGLKKLDDADAFDRNKLKAQFVQNFTQQQGAA